MRSNILEGITRPRRSAGEFSNPRHTPLTAYNRVRMQVVGPDEHGRQVTKQTVEHVHNVMATYGLSRLVSLLAGGALNCSDWIGGMRIGTDNTAAASTDSRLLASTGSIDLTDAADVIEAGARTLRAVGTFASDNPAGAAQIREIGLYASSNVTTGIVNRIDLTGANSVNKGASDSIQVSLDVVFTTA
jgi:hypothetical protein